MRADFFHFFTLAVGPRQPDVHGLFSDEEVTRFSSSKLCVLNSRLFQEATVFENRRFFILLETKTDILK